MQINVLDVVVWILEAWLLIVVLKWGIGLLLGAIGLDADRLVRRLRRLGRRRDRPAAIGHGRVYLIGFVADGQHEVVHAADAKEAMRIGAKVLGASEGELTITEVYERVLSR
jgi:hypothetical protein